MYKLNLIDKHSRKQGLRGKIDAKCIECIYDPIQHGTWREQVLNCTCNTCPLFSVRPLPIAKSNTLIQSLKRQEVAYD